MKDDTSVMTPPDSVLRSAKCLERGSTGEAESRAWGRGVGGSTGARGGGSSQGIAAEAVPALCSAEPRLRHSPGEEILIDFALTVSVQRLELAPNAIAHRRRLIVPQTLDDQDS